MNSREFGFATAFMFVLAVTLLSMSHPAYAPAFNVTQQPGATDGIDAYLKEDGPTINFGTATTTDVRNDDIKKRRGVFWFNISNISSNARINSATLELNQSSSAATFFAEVRRLTASWTESGVTWNSRDGTNNWATAGGDYDTIAYDNISIDGTLGFKSWNVTTLVQQWVNGTYTNNGFIILSASGSPNGQKSFDSSDGAASSKFPRLNISYIIPLNITFVSPTPTNSSTINTSWAFINISITYGNATNATLEWNGTVNYTMSNLTASPSANWYFNRTSLSKGNYTYKVFANDSNRSAFDVSSVQAVTVNDVNPPILIIQNPLNKSFFNSTTILLNYTVSDDVAVDACWYMNATGTNVSLTNCQNTTFTALDNKQNNITVYANDTLNNFNSTQIFFTVDTVVPSLTLNLPGNNSNISAENITFNFTAYDNLNASFGCSIFLDGILNQTNSSTQNNTLTNFAINGIAHGSHNWSVGCNDGINTNMSGTRNFFVNMTPILSSISDSPDPIKGGNVITITASGIDDPNNDTLNFYCSESSATPNSTNTVCTGGTTVDTTPPYSLSCTYATAADDAARTASCRVYDGKYYSNVSNTTYTTDSTPPSTTINNVAGDPDATYYDTVNDGVTNITVDGESGMSCRYSTSDLAYSGMSNDCTIVGTQATCSPTTTTQGLDAYNFYVACKDSLANEQNSTQNLNILSLVHDWTAPTTTDNSSTDVQVPPYVVNITEQDNLFGSGSIETKYCTDTLGNCTPNTIIDSGETITFTSANRGTNFFRYNSTDFNKTINTPGNIQATQNKTIRINQLPVFSSASSNITTVKGGGGIRISTNNSDADSGQTLKLFVCNSTTVSSSGCTHATYCSNTTGSANSSCSFTAESDDTTHAWFAFLYDSLNESATANKSGTYTTDSTQPLITISFPENKTYTQSEVPASIGISESSDWAGYCLDSCASNVSMNQVSSILWSATITTTTGTHQVKFYANDTTGNMNVSTAVVFGVDTTGGDTTPPDITVFSPSNNSYLKDSSVLFNISLNENGNWSGVSINSTANQTMGNNTNLKNWNKSISLANGRHNATFYANDTSGNVGNSSVIFFAVDTQAPQNASRGFEPSDANDTADVKCFSFWTDNVELSHGFVEDNATGSLRNSSQISLSGTSGSLNKTISASDTSPGLLQCRVYAFDKANNANATTFIINLTDRTTPITENISYAPTAPDDLDPNITVNVTANITDNVGIGAALLQYKLTNASDFTNMTMNLLYGNRYNGSFTPDISGNWSFRILTSDSSGNQNVSLTTNLTIEFDKTWSKSTNIPSTKTIVKDQARFISLGNITVTNTADQDLNFTAISAQTFISFNGTGRNSIDFIVNKSGNTTTLNSSANTTGFSVGEYNYNMTISSYTINPSLVSTQNISGLVVIQNVPGPFLSVSIGTYDSTLDQGQTNVTLSASVTNLGSDDATDTWLAWSIPSDWSVTLGTLNKSLGFIGIGQSASNTITVSISSSASTGAASITASSNSSKGGEGSDTKSVTIGTPTVVTQTVTQTTSTGGTSGGTTVVGSPRRELLLQSKETFEIVRGLGDAFPISVTNPFYGSSLDNVTLQVSGFLSRYIKVTPDILRNIGYNRTKQFNVTIIAPTYTAIGTFSLNLTIKGVVQTGVGTEKFTENRLVTLEIHAAGKEETNTTIADMEKTINELSEKGFGVNSLKRLLERAKSLFGQERYDNVIIINDEMKKIKESALQSSEIIEDVKQKTNAAEESFLSIVKTKKLLSMAIAAFSREDYEIAMQRAHDAQLTYAAETSGKFSVLKFIIDYWHFIIIFLVIGSIACIFAYRRALITKLTTKLKNMDVEEATLLTMIKDVQKKAFVDKSVGMETYGEVVRKCESRLAEIKQLRTNMRTKRIGIIKTFNELVILKSEYNEFLKNIEALDDTYLNKGIMSTETYEKRSEQYLSRKVDLKKEIAFLEAKLAKEKKGAVKIITEKIVGRIVGIMIRLSVKKVDKK